MAFIKIDRKFFDGKFWKQKRTFSQAEAWIDLVQSARFEAETETRLLANGKFINIKRGELHASLRYLADRWGWGVEKTKRFIDYCIDDGSIERKVEQGESILTLTKYEYYNKLPNSEPNTDQYADRTPTDTPTEQTKEYKELEERKEERKDTNVSSLSGEERPTQDAINYAKIVDFFNTETKGVFGCVRYPISEQRQGSIRARIREHGMEAFKEMIKKAAKSDFLKGGSKSGFKASFDWMIKPNNFPKIIEGNYDNRVGDKATRRGMDEIIFEQ